jgi:hypothetical protein
VREGFIMTALTTKHDLATALETQLTLRIAGLLALGIGAAAAIIVLMI